MTQDERKILVDMQVERAHRFLNQADEMMKMGYSDMAVNRFYYACFHIVQALFIQREIVAHTHSGMSTQFSKYFVKTGLVEIGMEVFWLCCFSFGKRRITIVRMIFQRMRLGHLKNLHIGLWKRLMI